MSELIHRQMTIDSMFQTFPGKAQRLAQELSNAGLQCAGCHASTWETLEAGAMGHGMSTENVDKLVERLNTVLNEKTVAADAVVITDRAAKKYLEILDSEGKQGWGLRFAEKAGGCNGFEYLLDYSEKATSDDKIFESKGIEIHIHKNMLGRLLGSEIDYVEGLYNAGFKVSNPNVNSACGCGSSHGY